MLHGVWVPLLATLLLHGVVLGAFWIEWPEERESLLQNQRPKYVQAKLVVLEKPKAKPKASKPKSSNSKATATRQPAPKTESKPKSVTPPKVNPKPDNSEQLAKQKAAAEAKAREAKRQAEQREAERRQQLQEAQRKELAAAIADEEEAIQAATDSELVQSYTALIAMAVEAQWSRPPNARNGMQAVLMVDLIPTGEVVAVNVVKSSGNTAFDRSALTAVRRARQFPELKDLPPHLFEQNFRRFNFLFRPEDLRR